MRVRSARRRILYTEAVPGAEPVSLVATELRGVGRGSHQSGQAARPGVKYVYVARGERSARAAVHTMLIGLMGCVAGLEFVVLCRCGALARAGVPAGVLQCGVGCVELTEDGRRSRRCAGRHLGAP